MEVINAINVTYQSIIGNLPNTNNLKDLVYFIQASDVVPIKRGRNTTGPFIAKLDAKYDSVHLAVSYDFSAKEWKNDFDGSIFDDDLWKQWNKINIVPLQPQMNDIFSK